MTTVSSATFSPGMQLDDSLISETSLKFFNGPNAGYIDLKTAEHDMPWFFGATEQGLGPVSNSGESTN